MTQRHPLWRVAGWPLAASLVCLLGGGLVLWLDEDSTPYNCDFSCAMASIGWQDQLGFALIVCGVVAFLMFVLVCLAFWVFSAVDFIRDRWR
jgi:hypothetical protein